MMSSSLELVREALTCDLCAAKPYTTFSLTFALSADNGKVIKAINAASAAAADAVSPVIIEELQVFPPNMSVRNLRIVRTDSSKEGRLIVVSDDEVLSIPLHRCNDRQITSCT